MLVRPGAPRTFQLRISPCTRLLGTRLQSYQPTKCFSSNTTSRGVEEDKPWRGRQKQVFHTQGSPGQTACWSLYTSLPRSFTELKADLPVPRNRLPTLKHPLVIVLATPGLARIFEKENEFIPNFLKRAFGDEGRDDYKVDILGAVVDQVSLPAQWAAVEASVSHKYHAGMEGVSFMVTTHRVAKLNMWGGSGDSKDVDAEESISTLGELGNYADRASVSEPHVRGDAESSGASLSIVMSTQEDYLAKLGDEYLLPLIRHTVKLPLTQTTFLNGRMYTLVAQSWQLEKNTTGVIDAILTRDRNMTNATIHIPLDKHPAVPFRANFKEWQPLTPPRRIAKSAGNVIRTFKSSKGLMGEMPASEELEAALEARMFSSHARSQTQVYEVWAQVTPKERRLDLPRGMIDIEGSLEQGDRFYKVLSGGGGWGSKRGLIALDDEAAFEDDPEINRESSTESEDSLPSFFQTPFAALVRPGDVVRFIGAWFARAPPMAIRRAQALPSQTRAEAVPRWFHARGGTSLRFGATSPLSTSPEDHSGGSSPITDVNDTSSYTSRDLETSSSNIFAIPTSSSTFDPGDHSDTASSSKDIQGNPDTKAPPSDSFTASASDHSSEAPLTPPTPAYEERLYPKYTHTFAHLACYGHFGALSDHGASLSLDTFTPTKPTSNSSTTRPSRPPTLGADKLGNIVRTKLPPWSSVSYCEKPFTTQPSYSRQEYFQRGENRLRIRKAVLRDSVVTKKGINLTEEERSEMEEMEAARREWEREMRMEKERRAGGEGGKDEGGSVGSGSGSGSADSMSKEEEDVDEGLDMWEVLKQTHEREEAKREWETGGGGSGRRGGPRRRP